MTRKSWGHNIDITRWDTEERTGKAAIWVTPRPKVGDLITVRSQQGTMELKVTKVEPVWSVDDMSWIELVDPNKKEEEESDEARETDS